MRRRRNIRYKLLHRKAKVLDQLIDAYKRARDHRTFPHADVSQLVHFIFPGSGWVGRGAFKRAYRVSSNVRNLVLKTSNDKNIRNDWRAYTRLPAKIRNRYFGKVYWKTRYCLLQKYGKEGKVPPQRLKKLKEVGQRYGLSDVRRGNIRRIGGVFKIIDANVGRRP